MWFETILKWFGCTATSTMNKHVCTLSMHVVYIQRSSTICGGSMHVDVEIDTAGLRRDSCWHMGQSKHNTDMNILSYIKVLRIH